ncbi:MAG: immunoglobulin domain-containing protein [Verrucomicrobia bacterium]|nr:immunoglobulin domain-containing protein [Verrucomicrobiota bacterium]
MKNPPASPPTFSRPRAGRRSTCSVLAVALSLLVGATLAPAQISVGTLAGSAGSSGTTDATGGAARFNKPAAVAVDPSSGANAGTLYVADSANHAIRRITAAGVVTTLAGTAGLAGSADGLGSAARFRNPQGLAIDSTGANLYVADTGNSTLRRIDLASGAVTTLAGTVGTFSTAEGTGTAAQFNWPIGLVVGAGDTALYVADNGNHTIRRVTLPGAAVTTLAGSPGNPGAANGTGAAARFFLPQGLAADATTLYVADAANHTLRTVALATSAVATLAGSLNPSVSGSTDATGTAATFKEPGALALRGTALYVADSGNSTVRQIALGTGAVTTLAGAAQATGSTDALGTAARFAAAGPLGIAVDSAGNFYAADTSNHTIRKGGPTAAPSVGTQPANQTIGVGGTVTFTVVASGNPTPTFQWQRNPGGTGTFADVPITPPYDGVTSASLSIAGATAAMNGDQFRCVIRNAVGTVTTSAVTLLVTQSPAFTSASSAQFAVGVPGSFTVTATGSPAPTFAITAGADPSAIGVTLSPAGVLSGTPTSATGSPFAFTVTATSAGSGTITQNFILTVQTGAGIATPPANATAAIGANATFSVIAGGFPASYTYQWYRAAAATPANFSSLGAGDTTYTGTQTATLTVVSATLAMHGDVFRCVVSNGFGLPATSASATLTVSQIPAFTSVANTTFAVGQASSYQLVATGSPAPTFAISTGTAPTAVGVTLSATGLLAGTPTATTGAPFTFTVLATNVAGTAAQNFTLNLIPAGAVPGFTTQPTSQTATIGVATTFTVVAAGLPAPTLRWQRQAAGTTGFTDLADGGAYSGTTTATLTVTGVTTGMNGDQFQCVATNTGGSATSTAVSLTSTLPTIIGTFAGEAGLSGNVDATGRAARFSAPSSIAIDRAGNFYVADTVNCTIRKITPAGVVTTLAGSPGVAGSADGPAATARFNAPSGVAVDATGQVYVADTFNHTIRVITPAGVVSTLAGSAGVQGAADGTGAEARFAYPTGVAVNAAGVVYVADSSNHTIRAITPAGVTTTYAGVAGTRGSADGFANIGGFSGDARFANPTGVAVDAAGQVYVADTFNHTIRKITPTANVTTLAGLAGTPGAADGTGAAARFYQPGALALDSAGSIWIADTFNHTIRKLTTSAAGAVATTTLAGLAGAVGSADDVASAARFSQPGGIAVDRNGVVYLADTKNFTIRRGLFATAPGVATPPASRGVLPGLNATFTVVATGLPAPGYQWQRKAAAATDFTNLTNNATYVGVTTATLTVVAVTTAMEGDQFRCVLSNFISPDAVSAAATLAASLTTPAFTSAASATFTAGQAGSFTVTTTGTPAPVVSATGLPTWAAFNATTGVLSGTPPDATGAPFAITLTAGNGLSATQNFSLNVFVPPVAPTISSQPAALTLERGASATFTVVATGTAPLSYQWSRNGTALAGATAATLTLANAQPDDLGTYTVRVTNSAGSVTSSAASLNLRLAPVITTPPRAQVVLAGTTATLSVAVLADPTPTYQWRFNGAALAGATSPTLVLANASAATAGNYEVVVTSPLGTVTSSLVQLSVTTTGAAPVITSAPVDRTVIIGAGVSFAAQAAGVPAVSYQWRKDGQPLTGATAATLTLATTRAADAGSYDVVVTNEFGTATSSAARLKLIARSYAGTYFSPAGGTTGGFALLVRADNSATLLGVAPGASGGNLGSLAFGVDDNGRFTYTAGTATVTGAIGPNGTVSLAATGGITATLTGSKLADTGAAQTRAGFYRAGVAGGSGAAFAIVGATGQIAVVTQTSATLFDGGLGTLDSAGRTTIATAAGSIAATIAADGATISVTSVRNNQTTTFAGASEAITATQRLGNISTRARVDSGGNIAVAGFVISGTESKPVLIRAIGPTLVGLGLNSALGNPKLDLYRGSTVIATNAGWSTAGNPAAIVAATAQVGGFALAPGTADSVIFTTLPPGAYTAQVSDALGGSGVALLEVYDLSVALPGQKLFNISTRATAGAGDATLIAGLSVNGTGPKRVLIRAIGPGLAQFGLTTVLETPRLQLFRDGQVIAANTGLATSPDAAEIATVSAQVGAFAVPPAGADCALLLNLPPGNYSATVSSVGPATGTAVIEVYEVP